MKLIVGLGNPGLKYRSSRHNAGFLVLDFLLGSWGGPISAKPVWRQNKRTESKEALVRLTKGAVVVLAKPQTLMNASGRAVKKLLAFYKVMPGELLVVHDDLDLRLGEYKLQWAKGPKVHNGLNSVEDGLGTKDFWRLRIGVDARDTANRTSGEEYVLRSFTVTEKRVLEALIEDKLLPQIAVWMTYSSPTPPRENPSG